MCHRELGCCCGWEKWWVGWAGGEREQLRNRQPLTTAPVLKAFGSLEELPGFFLKQPLPIVWVVGCVLCSR